MRLRWTHNGVALRASVRHRKRWRALAWGVLGSAVLLTGGWLSLLQEPDAVPEFESCLVREARGSALCQTIQPSYQTWNFETESDWVRARGASLVAGAEDSWIVEHLRPSVGVQDRNNMLFLSMVSAQLPRAQASAVSGAQLRHAKAEFEALKAIEDAIWDVRVINQSARANHAFEQATWIRHALQSTVWLWMPILLFAWIVVLVLFQRTLGVAKMLSLDVNTSGVKLDGRRIPRSAIAFLSLEGQRIRIERWTGPPLYTRPLPTEVLAVADEICASLGGLEDAEDPRPEAPPQRLRRLVSAGR